MLLWPAAKIGQLINERADRWIRIGVRREGVPGVLHAELEKGESKENSKIPISGLPQPHVHQEMGSWQMPGRDGGGESGAERPAAENNNESGETLSKDDIRANVVRRYKVRVQELTQNLSQSQALVAQQGERIGQLENELKKHKEAANLAAVERNEPKAQDANSRSVEMLRAEVNKLTTELDRIKTEREIELLSALPNEDTSGLVQELQSQLNER